MKDYATASYGLGENGSMPSGMPKTSLTLLSNTSSPSYSRKHTPNSRYRWTEYMDGSKAEGLIDSIVFAEEIGLPLNQWLTIHFEKGQLDTSWQGKDWREQDALGRFLRLIGQWFATKRVPMTYVWVMENAVGRGAHLGGNGMHAHILLHCPRELVKDFQRKANGRWLELSGMKPLAGVLHIRRVAGRQFDGKDKEPEHRHANYRKGLAGLLVYCLEGLDPEDHERLKNSENQLIANVMEKLERSASEPIYGRRVSRSENIGLTARKRHSEAQARSPH